MGPASCAVLVSRNHVSTPYFNSAPAATFHRGLVMTITTIAPLRLITIWWK